MSYKNAYKNLFSFTATLLLLFFQSAYAFAALGDLDPTFGNGGKVITTGIGGISDIALQTDGKIVAVGGDKIVRYNANGSLDSSFGTGGIVLIELGGNIAVYANSVAVQSDGKIVVAAEIEDVVGGGIWGFAVVRCNPNGTLDTTFNVTGIILYPIGNGGDSVAIQTDGKIVVCSSGDFTSYVHRFNSNGTPDTSFNGTGSIITPNSSASSVAIQPDGKIVVVGKSGGVGGNFMTSRYNADGSPDASFGGTGIVITSFDGYGGGAHDLAIQSNGKIVAKGIIGNENKNVALIVRYNLNGSTDTTFGVNGVVYEPYDVNTVFAGDMAIQPDGKIVTVGRSPNESGDFAVRRYNSNGLPDPTFNGEGIVTTDFGFADWANAVAIQADGKIVAAGYSYNYNGSSTDFALARYQDGSSFRTRYDFDGDGRADLSVFRPSDRTWYLNQSTNGFSATQFGLSTDKLTPADYDGDGQTDISVYRDGTWYWLKSSDNSFNARQFGIASDVPVPADHSGDGRAELAVYRGGDWYTLNLANDQFQAVQFGISSDRAVPADFDGDGRADFAVYRKGVWYLLRSTAGFAAVQFGIASDKPVVGDYDGDSRSDYAVYRDGVWYLLQSTQGFRAFQFGLATDIPAPADYDGDGRADAAVYREGVWYLLQSTNGFAAQQFGLTNDKPVLAVYLP